MGPDRNCRQLNCPVPIAHRGGGSAEVALEAAFSYNIHGRKNCHNEKRKSFNSSTLVRLSYKPPCPGGHNEDRKWHYAAAPPDGQWARTGTVDSSIVRFLLPIGGAALLRLPWRLPFHINGPRDSSPWRKPSDNLTSRFNG